MGLGFVRVRLFRALGVAVLAAFLSSESAAATAPIDLGLPSALSPGAEGFSSERLVRVESMFKREIEAEHFAGATWMIVRDGQIVTHGAAGYSNIAGKRAMAEDSVFRIMSMSKLITTVTCLTLIEEGRINLDDPVTLYLPELAIPKVYIGGPPEAPQLVPANGPVTIRQLLTQTSGYSYGFFDTGPIRSIYDKADLWNATTLPEFVKRASTLPLIFQPGTAWNYGINTDLLGAIIEKVAGKPLGDVMRERIFAPLGMDETGFTPPADPSRLATIYEHGQKGLTEMVSFHSPRFESGGGGLYSTLHDYARFAEMLLNKGSLNGVRILGPKTVEMMTTSQVGYLNPRPIARYVPQGFGFGVRVQLDDPSSSPSLGSPGRYGWEGILTTYVSIDPKERLILLEMMQLSPYDDGEIFERFTNTAYQAIEK